MRSLFSGTAIGGGASGDFTDLVTNTINFAISEMRKTCVVTITNDQLDEMDEDFTVKIENPIGATLGTTTTATVTITDDNGKEF